ncbi:HPF/RaiA family ribosome-associated protein [Marinicella rhabdoformis]|uniref:HPF/RaiA family ribosome-associated protein n=1 Tax=Marinicella rhabdoformis TaxID=2580566 RepID=UPI0012AEB7B0|nr:HPF/RaiA family ribosome-associated protein [Marinicella rhabdoformis]
MQIQVNVNHGINGGELLTQYVEDLMGNTLNHHKDQVTRIEVHLADENGPKGGDDDLRCTIEARISGLHPIAVTHHASDIHQAIDGAAERIQRTVNKTIEKRRSY